MDYMKELGIITENADEINRLTGLVVDELERRNYPVTFDGVRYNICKWRVAKDNLIQMFSKHPNWNSETYMVAFDTDWERTINTNTIHDFFAWIRDILYYNSCDISCELECSSSSIENRLYEFMYCCQDLRNPVLSEEDCENISCSFENNSMYCGEYRFGTFKLPDYKVGMKTSRWVNKLCKAIPCVSDNGDYEHRFAGFADAINPILVTRHTLISLNPLDYLLCANGAGNWRSCHAIDRYGDNVGGYSAGNLSYMNDDVSFVFYTVNKDYNGDRIELEPKITRNYFAYDNYRLLQQRVYPQNTDGANNIYEQCRKTVQKVIADCLEEPDLWTVRDGSYNSYYCMRGAGSLNYHDWELQSYELSSISVLNSKTNFTAAQTYPAMNIGAVAYACNCAGRPLTWAGCIIDNRIRA